VPQLSYSVVPVNGGLVPGAESSFGGSTSVQGASHRRIAKMDVPVAGRYRVRASGEVSAFFEPTLRFGAPNASSEILLIGAILFVGLALVTAIAQFVVWRENRSGPPPRLTLDGAKEMLGASFAIAPLAILPVIGIVAVAVALLNGGSFHIPPSGRVPPSSPRPSSSEPASFTGPTGSNVIGAASAGSLFNVNNLTPVLADLRKRFGANASIASLTLYPGEVDLVLDQQRGVAQPVRIERDGAISEKPTSGFNSSPQSIYLSQLSAAVPHAITAEIAARYAVPTERLGRLVLLTDLPGQNAGWRVYRLGSSSQTFQALLDGSNLKQLGR
jgi:hypothetical protein